MDFDFPLLLDGGTGSNLIAAGMRSDERVADFILSHPNVIKNLQRGYIESGAKLIYTPTFGVNPEKYGKDCTEINRALIRLTKETVSESGRDVKIIGDMSPCGLFMPPMGNASFDEMYAAFAAQVKVFCEENIDLVSFMTMYSLAEARIALLACRELTDKPVFCSMTVNKFGKTMTGSDVCACMQLLSSMGAACVGINCSTGPSDMTDNIKRMSDIAAVPVFCKPNAGTDTSNYLSPQAFSDDIRRLIDAGASVVGGCCGTTPAHIKAVADIIHNDGTNATVTAINNRKRRLSEHGITALATEKSYYEFEGKPRLSPVTDVESFLDDFYDFDKDEADVAHIAVETEDEAGALVESSYMFDIPLAISCGDGKICEYLARNYCGQLLFSPDCETEPEQMSYLSSCYGSIFL